MPVTRRSSKRITAMSVIKNTNDVGPRIDVNAKENVGSEKGKSGKRQIELEEFMTTYSETHFKNSVLQDQPSPKKCFRSNSKITRLKENRVDTCAVLSQNALIGKASSGDLSWRIGSIASTSEEIESETEENEILSYEKMRMENLRDNAQFLASLGIHQAKYDLQRHTQKSKKNNLYQQPKTPKEAIPREPTRRSMRVRNITPTYVAEPPAVLVNNYNERNPSGPLDMTSFLFPSVTENMHNKLCNTLRSASKVKEQTEPLSSSLKSFMNEFKKMKITESRVVKVVKQRIFSLAIHPCEEKILVAAGDKWGGLGFWDVESQEDAVTAYTPHTSPINHVVFCPWNQSRVYTCSYDGTLRCGEFEKVIFSEVYAVAKEEDTMLRAFVFQSEHVMCVAQSDGCVALIDQRTSGTCAENIYHLHQKGLRAVDIHPAEKHVLLTGSVDGSVCLWDLRKMKSKTNVAIARLLHSRSVDSACFSPITGNKILSCSSENTVNIFDSSTLSKNIEKTCCIRHNNYVGRWLTKLRAVWHPSREDLFVTGSMERPRQIEIFSDSGQMLHTFSSLCLNSVCSLNVIHPSRNILVGGNSSGRVHVFM